MNADDFLPFEKKVFSGLLSCGVDRDSVSEASPLGVAVSGGADSLSLLLSLAAIFPSSLLRVITVDHGIRSEKESGGDAQFVKQVCDERGISCTLVVVPRGQVFALSQKRKRGVEEAARFVRHEAFSQFIDENHLRALCLAHTQNDQLETVLMRFLQGSGSEGAFGIRAVRGALIRPMLSISRDEIEAYLHKKNAVWRTDATNADTSYLRNNIRASLMCFLDEQLPSWRGAVLTGSKKMADDAEFLGEMVQSFPVERLSETRCALSAPDFFALHPALFRRVAFRALNEISFGARFPFYLIEKMRTWANLENAVLTFADVRVSRSSDRVFFERVAVQSNAGERGFSVLLSHEGDRADFPQFSVVCEPFREQKTRLVFLPSEHDAPVSVFVTLPVIVRSVLNGDVIADSCAHDRRVGDIFESWHIPAALRSCVPLVEENMPSLRLCAVIASPFGFKNWIVEDSKLR